MNSLELSSISKNIYRLIRVYTIVSLLGISFFLVYSAIYYKSYNYILLSILIFPLSLLRAIYSKIINISITNSYFVKVFEFFAEDISVMLVKSYLSIIRKVCKYIDIQSELSNKSDPILSLKYHTDLSDLEELLLHFLEEFEEYESKNIYPSFIIALIMSKALFIDIPFSYSRILIFKRLSKLLNMIQISK